MSSVLDREEYRSWAKEHKISSRVSGWSARTFNKHKQYKYPYFRAKGIETKYVATWAAGLAMAHRDHSD